MRRRPRGARRLSGRRADRPHCGRRASPQAPLRRGARAYAGAIRRVTAASPRRGRPVAIGSRSIGVSLQPAIPRRVAPQQSPLPLHWSPSTVAQSRSAEAIKSLLNRTAGMQSRSRSSCPAANASVISTLRAECHFYLAPTHSVDHR
jgi:hypothetical protein